MSTFQPFTPGANFSLAVTTTTGAVNVTGNGTTLRLANVAATECFIKLGTSAVTAATTDFSMPANSQIFLTASNAITYVAAITASGTATLRISRGDGGI